MLERRNERRVRMLKEGKVLLSDFVSANCTVRDISPSGARLELEGPISLPADFRLWIVSVEMMLPATAVWQRGLEAGVRFTGIGVAGRIEGALGSPRPWAA